MRELKKSESGEDAMAKLLIDISKKVLPILIPIVVEFVVRKGQINRGGK